MTRPVSQERLLKRYCLVTAAHNEEKYVGALLDSVASQTLPPTRWIVVSDGSTDGTDAIIQKYADKYPFIQLFRVSDIHDRGFAPQVNAINLGLARLCDIECDYVGNLDADISLGRDYFEQLIHRFEEDANLGLAGGMIYELDNTEFKYRITNNIRSVAHGVQLFRRECLEAVGAYVPFRYGGPDWYAEITARMKGWRVRAFPDLTVFHHRRTGTANGLMVHCYKQGLMDYCFGSHPIFECAKCARRIVAPPYMVGALMRLVGFLSGYCRREPRPVSDGFVHFLRAEQKARLTPRILRAIVAGTRAPG